MRAVDIRTGELRRMGGWLALAVMVGCGDEGSDTAQAQGWTMLIIESPADGSWFDQGGDVEFLATGRSAGGAEAEVIDAVCSTEGWTQTGASFTASDLPPGNLDILLEASVDGEVLTASVEVTVWATTGE